MNAFFFVIIVVKFIIQSSESKSSLGRNFYVLNLWSSELGTDKYLV